MKKTSYLIIAGLCLSLFACKKTCTYEEKEIQCEQLDAYNTFLSYEAKINATFNDLAPALSTTEELALREEIVSYYDSNKTNILAAYDIIGGYGFKPTEIYDMRVGEIDHFKKKIDDEAFTAEFLKKLDIEESVLDTCFYEDCEPQTYVFWKIKNNSDSTISGMAIDKNYEKDGAMVYAKQETYFMLSKEQIFPTPTEEENAVVKPGSVLELSFETNDFKKAKPEIKRISFAK